MKVVILAYDFPPYISVGGLRPYSWYKYMREYGIYPIIITRQWDSEYGNHLDYISPGNAEDVIIDETDHGTLIQTPYKPNISNRLFLKYGEAKFKLVRKIISGFYEFAQYVLPIGPKAELYVAAKEYLKNNKVEAIIATGDPFVLFKYASDLSSQFEVPWIADYRDPWSEDIAIQKYILYKKWSSYFEKKIVPKAVHVITVSEFLKIKIGELTGANKIDILLNGYDSDLITDVEGIDQNREVFSIAYMGTFYEWYPIENFLRTCLTFIKESSISNFQINFYGINKETEISDLLKGEFNELLPYVHIFPKQQNAQVLKLLAENNVFLLFNNYSFLGTKIFDYLALRRKILLCYTDDFESKRLKDEYYLIEELDSTYQHLQEDMLCETNSGIIVRDGMHLKDVIVELYEEFSSTGKVKCDSVKFEQYSRKLQVQRLVNFIKDHIKDE